MEMTCSRWRATRVLNSWTVWKWRQILLSLFLESEYVYSFWKTLIKQPAVFWNIAGLVGRPSWTILRCQPGIWNMVAGWSFLTRENPAMFQSTASSLNWIYQQGINSSLAALSICHIATHGIVRMSFLNNGAIWKHKRRLINIIKPIIYLIA